MKEATEFIKKKHSIALMIDQRVSEGERINFFGHPALTTTLPAQLSMKYQMDYEFKTLVINIRTHFVHLCCSSCVQTPTGHVFE